MPKVKYHVRLSGSERKTLLKMVSKGSASAKSIMHANVLLAADENGGGGRKSVAEIAQLFNVHSQTVQLFGNCILKKGYRLRLAERSARRRPLRPRLPAR